MNQHDGTPVPEVKARKRTRRSRKKKKKNRTSCKEDPPDAMATRTEIGQQRMESRRQMGERRNMKRQQRAMSQTRLRRRVAITQSQQPRAPLPPLPTRPPAPESAAPFQPSRGESSDESEHTPTSLQTQSSPSPPRYFLEPAEPELEPEPEPGSQPRQLPKPSPGRRKAQNPRPTMAFRDGARHTGLHVNGTTNMGQGMMSHPKAANIFAQWSNWESLTLSLSGVPAEVNTFTLWKSFREYGSVEYVELFETASRRDGKARIRFRPPPKEAICHDGKHRLELANGQSIVLGAYIDPRRTPSAVPSPVQPRISYPASLEIPVKLLDLGPSTEERTLLPLRTIGAIPAERVRCAADLYRRELNIFFHLVKYNTRAATPELQRVLHEYRLRVPFAQLTGIFRVTEADTQSFFVALDSPPIYHRKLLDLTPTFSDSENVWRSADTWFRQTDIVHSQQELVNATVSLRKSKPLVNIGRWTTIRLAFDNGNEQIREKLATLWNIFRDFNIDAQDDADFKIAVRPTPAATTIWRWVDPPSTQASKPATSLEDLAENEYISVPFTVRYQLEVCISHGYLNEYTMGKEFASRLASLEEQQAKNLLEHVAGERKVYYDPMKIFDIPFVKGATNVRIPKYCCYVRSARVTPSTIYFNTPSVDISNRVIRHYIEYADRFLRVRFTDEKYEGRINPTHNSSMDEVFTRIKRAMMNGITIGGRRYEFLAFGNSQFREHGAYFFASLPNLTAASIRAWMGHFSDIRNIAKHAARLGQCFSTTRAVTGCPVQITEIPDIERNGFNFSDGVGRISKFLAQMVMTEFKIRTPSGEPPSVFQFRLGGCKGILTMSPEAQRGDVHIRKSQYKFAAVHNGLEIIRHSQFAMATLNRQLIVVLSSLGIPDEVFIDKLLIMLENLDLAMTDEAQAIHMLQKYIDPNEMTLLLANMVQDGFQKANEPFVRSLLELWRAWQIKYLKEKAKIGIEKGACLFGCVDDTGTLKGYFNNLQPTPDATYEQRLECLPEVFIQVSRADGNGKYEIIEGPCIVGRNPSLHPGDIRVVKAVNVPELHHLRNVVVFPQTGDRDIPSMCSGGDLDGDDYIVIWDQDMVPEDWFREPMDYSATRAQPLNRNVTVNDITSFFVTYMKNDRLPQIAHAHLAYADYLDDGVNDERCIKLAALHSAAVDYNKTGIPAQMSKDLIPRKWPHFMEKKHKPKEAQYVSKKILGQLYDIVERVDFRPKLEAPFDERILNSGIEVTDDLLATATELKSVYDADMHRIMAQHEIKTEFEVWSTFVLSHANMSKDYKFHEELGQISTALRERHLNICYEKAGGKDFEALAPLAVAMYKVTCDQMNEALSAVKPSEDGLSFVKDKSRALPLISFPWVLQPVLGKIANKHYDAASIPDPFGSTVDSNTNTHRRGSKKKPDGDANTLFGREIKTAEGLSKSGEVLELFHGNEHVFDPFSGLGDAFDAPATAQGGKTDATKSSADETKKEKTERSNSLIDFDDDFSLLPVSKESPHREQDMKHSSGSGNLMDTVDAPPALTDLTNRAGKQPTPKKVQQTPSAAMRERANAATSSAREVSLGNSMEEFGEEIIEQEGDVKPSAVDELERILGL